MVRRSLWHSSPRTIEDYLALAEGVKGITPSAIREYEADIGFAIDQIWLDELAPYTQIVKKTSTPIIYSRTYCLFGLKRLPEKKTNPLV